MKNKYLRAIIIALFLFNIFITSVYAEPKYKKYYSLDIDSLNVNVKSYLTSLFIDDETKQVFMNNVFVGIQDSDTKSHTLSTTNYTIKATITLSTLSFTASVDVKTQKSYKSAFKFEIEDNTYYVCYFYPDYEHSTTSQKIVAARNGDVYNFNTFTYTYGNDYMEFNVKLVHSTGDVYVNDSKIGTLSNTSVPIIYEYLGNNFPITSIDYMHGSLPQFSWTVASKATYPFYNRETYLSKISLKQDYEYSNKYLSLPSTYASNGAIVDEYTRVSGTSTTGTGVWKKTGNKIWVVCEYYENEVCGNAIRKEFPRYWAVYGSEADKTYPVESKTQYVKDYKTKYKNYYYPDSSWSNISNYQAPTDSVGGVVQYRYKTASWKDWTAWNEEQNRYCTIDCEQQSDKFYRYRTYTWGSWSDWTTTMYPSYACGSDVCRQETKTEYSDWTYDSSNSKLGNYTDQCYQQSFTKNYVCGSKWIYSDYKYGNTKTGYTDQCEWKYYNENYSCGYDYDYSDWGDYSKYKYGSYTDQCTSRTGNNSECGIKDYSYSNWGGWQDSKYGSYTGQCNSQTVNTTCKQYIQNASKCGYSYSDYGYYTYLQSLAKYNCGSKITSGTYKDKYRCAATRTAKRCSSAGCETYNTKTQYNCPKTRTTNYNSCTSYKCPKTRTTKYASCYMWNCPNSRTSEYASCTRWTCPKTKTVYYRYKWKSYSSWSDYGYKSAPYIPSVDGTELSSDYKTKYRYRYKSWTSWSSWISTTSTKTNSDDVEYEFRLSNGVAKLEDGKGTASKGSSSGGWYSGVEEKTLSSFSTDVAKTSTTPKTYGNLSMATQSEVNAWISSYAKDSSGQKYYDQQIAAKNQASDGKTSIYITWADFNYGITNSSYYTKAANDIEGRTIYSPYLYFYGWRFYTANTSVPSGTTQKLVNSTSTTNYKSNGVLIESKESVERDTKVIYFDYRDPLTNYKDDLPENWEGYEYLIEEIKNSDLASHKISVKLSIDDIRKMKEWLDNGGYDKIGTCDMLREFSYIFIDTDAELSSLLNSSKSCKIGGKD